MVRRRDEMISCSVKTAHSLAAYLLKLDASLSVGSLDLLSSSFLSEVENRVEGGSFTTGLLKSRLQLEDLRVREKMRLVNHCPDWHQVTITHLVVLRVPCLGTGNDQCKRNE